VRERERERAKELVGGQGERRGRKREERDWEGYDQKKTKSLVFLEYSISKQFVEKRNTRKVDSIGPIQINV
jgi:hypothetical protein